MFCWWWGSCSLPVICLAWGSPVLESTDSMVEKAEPKQKQLPAVDVSGGESQVWRCREQSCIGTWNVRSINQGKLDVVKQGMARVNIDILGMQWAKMDGGGQINSDGHHIYYCGQESLRRNGVALIVNKGVQNAALGYSLKNDRMISFPRQTIQYHSNLSLYLKDWCQRIWSWMVLWRPTRPSRMNIKERCPFHHRELECKVMKSRDTWSNRQVWPWSTKWSRAKSNIVLPREHTGHSKHPLPTT